MLQGAIRLGVLAFAGAILYNVLTHPRGTRVALQGVNSLFRTGLAAASGRGRL